MNPETVTSWIQTAGGAIDALRERGLIVYVLIGVLVMASMAGVKAIDRAAYARSGKPAKGANKRHNGYLVAVYPWIAMGLGGVWAVFGWLAVHAFGSFGEALWSGLITGGLTAFVFKGVSSAFAFRRKGA